MTQSNEKANPLVARSVTVGGKAQQIRLEQSYWDALEENCGREEVAVDDMCSDIAERIDRMRRLSFDDAQRVSMANAIRVFVVGYYRQAATEDGHQRAGHGRGEPFALSGAASGSGRVTH